MEWPLDSLDAVGFDLDYTLWDQEAFIRTFFDAIAVEFGRRLGWGGPHLARICRDTLLRIGPAHPRLFDQVLQQLGAWDPRLVAELVQRYRRHRPPVQPYPDALPALRRLREAGMRLFLVTDGHAPVQRYKAEALGLVPWFDQMVFTGDFAEERRKPSPFPFRLACARMGVDPGRCAYVGDNPACDVPGPRSLGMLTVGVATGPFAAAGAPGPAPHLRLGALGELAGLLAGAPARSAP